MAANSKVDDGYWLIDLMKDAYESTRSMGATTMLMCSIHNSGSLMTANIGDCSLLVMRVIPTRGDTPAHLQVIFRTQPTRYAATKPVQVQRLPHIPEERTHAVIKASKLETCLVQSGDYVVMGSDGLFDNMQEDDMAKIVSKFCPMDRAASTAVLTEAANALVNAAISREGSNPDDTTALVAAVVEVPDTEEYERWFWRSRGIQRPYAEPMNAEAECPTARTSGSAQQQGRRAAATSPAPPPVAAPPGPTAAQNRGRSMEPPPRSRNPAWPEQPLQDCTNAPPQTQNLSPSKARSPGAQGDDTQLRPNPNSPQGDRVPMGKGKGKGAKGDGGGKGPAAPDWWTKMAVPGKQAPPQQIKTGQGQLGAQAAQVQNHAEGEHYENPRLTSSLLRAHEVKMATADSIARYSAAVREAETFRRPPQIPEGRQMQMNTGPPRRNGNANQEQCVIS